MTRTKARPGTVGLSAPPAKKEKIRLISQGRGAKGYMVTLAADRGGDLQDDGQKMAYRIASEELGECGILETSAPYIVGPDGKPLSDKELMALQTAGKMDHHTIQRDWTFGKY